MGLLMTRKQVAALEARASRLVSKSVPDCEACTKKGRKHHVSYTGRSGFMNVRHTRHKPSVYRALGLKPPNPKLPPPPGKLYFRCIKCNGHLQRLMTPAEEALFVEIDEQQDASRRQMHHAWWQFQEAFKKRDRQNRQPATWRWQGWKLMEKVRQYAEAHPEVTIVRCDDLLHTSSLIVLVPHEVIARGRLDYYWGTSVVLIPQHGGPPAEFFLYGDHARGLAKALGRIVERHRRAGDRE